MNDILISVVVPAYNIESYLPRCLDSILAQTHHNLQIIVVNDGSTDGTGRVIDSYAARDDRIVPIHKENGGVSSARIAGINIANGTYIGFVDGDDYIEPNMYEHLLDNSIKYDADISHCGYKMVFPDGHEDLYYGTNRIVEQTNEQGLYDLLSGEFVEPGLWNKLYKKDIINFNDSLIWDSDIKINEDLLLNYIIFKKAKKAIFEDRTFYHYMLRKGSAATSKTQRHKITDPMKVFSLICNDTKNNQFLFPVIYTRYINLLINTVIQTAWPDEARYAKLELKKQIADDEFTTNCKSPKIKCMAILAANITWLYRIIRIFYEKITGVSKKYDV